MPRTLKHQNLKGMKKSTFIQGLVIGLILFLVSALQVVHAQSGMGIDEPNPLEMLDVNGAIKIGTDFNNNTTAPQGGAGTIRWNGTNFEGWDGTQWVDFGSTGTSNLLEDADADTKVQVEESPDEDIIRFDVAGNQVLQLERIGNFPYLHTTSNSVYLGNNLSSTVTGGYNTVVGFQAGGGLASGEVNTFIGANAGGNMQGGSWNVMMGNTAGQFMTGGGGNTVIGGSAGRNKTGGGSNVLLGLAAGQDNGTGGENVMVGPYAGEDNTGDRNVFLGRAAGQWSSGSSNVFIGNGAGRSEGNSNRLYIANSSTTSPLIYGEFDNEIIGINGNLGVGTQSPHDELHVDGSIRMVDGNQASGYIPVSDANGTMIWTDPATITTADDGDWTINGNNQYSTVSGNVGVGTTNPSQKLHVQVANNGYNLPLLLRNRNDTQSGGNSVGIGFTNETTGNWAKAAIVNERTGVWALGSLHFLTNNATNNTSATLADARMTITSNGNVGVGTTTPTTLFEVAGTASVTGNLGVGTNTPQQKLHIQVANNGYNLPLFLRNSNDTQSGGNSVGLGFSNETNGNWAKAAIVNERTAAWARGSLHFLLNDVADNSSATLADARMTITRDGNVGIGTTSPNDELHVQGAIRMVDGNQQVGYIPVSDANGTMIWTDPTTVVSNQSWSLAGNTGTDPTTNFIGTTDAQPLTIRVNGEKAGYLDYGTPSSAAFGFQALNVNSGSNNSAFGYQALTSNTTGNRNTAVGNALTSNTTGGDNTAVGDGALESNTTANSNSAFGKDALTGNTTGRLNTAVGRSTLASNTTGLGNTALGYNSMEDNTTGQYNVAIGSWSGHNNNMGSNNTYLGYSAGYGSTGSNNVFLGYSAGWPETGDNKLYIENTNTTSPLIYGEFDNDIVGINGDLAVGHQSPEANLDVAGDGSGTTSLLVRNGNDGSSFASNQIALGYNGGATFQHAIKTRHNSGQDATNAIDFFLWDAGTDANADVGTKHVMTIDGNGDGMVGVNTTAPAEELHVVGSIRMVDGNQQTGYIPISNSNGTMVWTDPTMITTAADGDGSSTNEIQTLSITGNDISLSNGGGTVSIPVQDELSDADSDTKVQVEESTDEDIIRFDIRGTEKWRMAGSRLEAVNNGNSVFIGENAGTDDDLSNNKNTYVGKNAGRDNITGYDNVAIGYNALAQNNSIANIAIGSEALASSTNSFANIAIGYSSLKGNNTGGNIAIGPQSGEQNTAGEDNVMIGLLSGEESTGSENVFLGFLTGQNNDGNGSVMLGYRAGQNEVNGNRLYIENSNSNTPLIYGEFDNNLLRVNGTLNINNAYSLPAADGTNGYLMVTDGSGNVAWTNPTSLTTASGDEIVDADSDTKIQVEESSDDDKIRFDTNGSERMIIDNAGRVGIATSSPTYDLTLGGNADRTIGVEETTAGDGHDLIIQAGNAQSGTPNNDGGTLILSSGAATGNGGINPLSEIVFKTATPLGSSSSVTQIPTEKMRIDAFGNVGIGTTNADDNLEVFGTVASRGITIANPRPVFTMEDTDANTWLMEMNARNLQFTEVGIGTHLFIQDMTGRVGVGTTAPSSQFQVGENGDGTFARANAWNTFSDRRWKKDFEVIPDALTKLDQVNGYFYNWKEGADSTQQLGVVAQEIEAILPQAVDTDENGYKSVDYGKLSAWLIQVNKEQQEIIEKLNSENASLTTNYASLSEDIEMLKALLNSTTQTSK